MVSKWSHTNEDMNWLESAFKERVTYGIVPGWKTVVVPSTKAVPLTLDKRRDVQLLEGIGLIQKCNARIVAIYVRQVSRIGLAIECEHLFQIE